jgi:galactoside O-acetyltransferase
VYTVSSDYSGEFFLNPTVPEQFTNPTIGPVTFEKFATIGAGTIVFPNVTLKTGAVTGAMSLVTKDLEPWTINIGIPAKKIKERKRNLINFEVKFKKYLDELNGKERLKYT